MSYESQPFEATADIPPPSRVPRTTGMYIGGVVTVEGRMCALACSGPFPGREVDKPAPEDRPWTLEVLNDDVPQRDRHRYAWHPEEQAWVQVNP